MNTINLSNQLAGSARVLEVISEYNGGPAVSSFFAVPNGITQIHYPDRTELTFKFTGSSGIYTAGPYGGPDTAGGVFNVRIFDISGIFGSDQMSTRYINDGGYHADDDPQQYDAFIAGMVFAAVVVVFRVGLRWVKKVDDTSHD